MSYSLNVHIWLDSDKSREITSYMHVLNSLDSIQGSSTGESEDSRFLRIRIFDKPFSVVVDRDTGLKKVEIASLLEKHWKTSRHVLLDSVYPIEQYDEEKDELVYVHPPLDISFYVPDYGLKDGYHERFGHIEFSFQNVSNFSVSETLIKKVSNFLDNKSSGKHLAMIARQGENYAVVKTLISTVIEKINPVHVITCTESDINPLVAHSIYHRSIEDFAVDLIRIARLHEVGGSYFSILEARPTSFLPPWKETSSYGYLRGRFGNRTTQIIAERVSQLAKFVLNNQERIKLSKQQVKRELNRTTDISVEELGEGVMISAKEAPFAYLEGVYFNIFDCIMNSSFKEIS